MAHNTIPDKIRRHPVDRIQAVDDDGHPVAITLYEHRGRRIRWIEWVRRDKTTGAVTYRDNQMFTGGRYDQAVTDFAEARAVVTEEEAVRR